MTDEEDAAAIGRKIKAFIAKHPTAVAVVCAFLAGAFLVWVL